MLDILLGRGSTACILLLIASCTVSPTTAMLNEETPNADADPLSLLGEMIAQATPDELSALTGGLSGEWPVTIGGESITLRIRVQLAGEGVLRATQYVIV
jgi:hypothetical protein